MPVTLEQAKATMNDKVDQQVIDEFRRSSLLLDRLIFDDAVSPGTGGSTLTYGYTQLKTPSSAEYRAINSEYNANVADREKKAVDLAVLGGAFEIDRVIQDTSGIIDELNFQLEQKVQAVRNEFHYGVINGDSAVNANSFDGLNKLLTGTSTELNTGGLIDLSNITDSNKFMILDELDNFMSELSKRPTMLLGNSKLINRIKAAARQAGYFSREESAFGTTIDAYDGIPLVDLGFYADTSNGTPSTELISPIVTRGENTGVTDLYAVSIGLDGFHGVSPQGGVGIKTYIPDFNSPGAVKKGEVEMVTGVALKQSRAAGVLRNIKVQ